MYIPSLMKLKPCVMSAIRSSPSLRALGETQAPNVNNHKAYSFGKMICDRCQDPVRCDICFPSEDLMILTVCVPGSDVLRGKAQM